MGGERRKHILGFSALCWFLSLGIRWGKTKLLPEYLEITPAGSLYYSRGRRPNRINPWTDAARPVHAHLARLKLLPRNVEITPECALQMVEISGREVTCRPPLDRPCN